jgi:hypothetical protein
MTSCKPVDTLIFTSKVTILPDPLFSNSTQFRQIVGALQYLFFTRPDICLVVNRVCQFMHAPTDSHWGAVKRILRYLRGTTTYGLHITCSSSFALHGFIDADWAGITNSAPTIWCDHLDATYLSANPIFHAHTKHVEVDYHFV